MQFQSKSKDLKTKRYDKFSSKTGKLMTKGDPVLQSKGRNNLKSKFKKLGKRNPSYLQQEEEGQPFCSIEAFVWMSLPHGGGQSALLSLPIQMLISSKRLSQTQFMFGQLFAHAQRPKSTHEINHRMSFFLLSSLHCFMVEAKITTLSGVALKMYRRYI